MVRLKQIVHVIFLAGIVGTLSGCGIQKTIANVLYEEDAAPWETVDAFYYPDRGDLTVHQAAYGLENVAACRSAVNAMARLNNDPSLTRGDYECGVGKLSDFASIGVYRLTVR
ncbi:hypothetical protein [Rhizobium giardinii]|uniref:Lipoprotein n=1 Tax=Rhizobium giardinii TaxID=56731 RepID=A0A7W8UHM9_9HYPH|nr:hypothetical protein [Rhizobium giardinii]MBB5539534.1 hypothetical protein [Rhizobium giardinii]